MMSNSTTPEAVAHQPIDDDTSTNTAGDAGIPSSSGTNVDATGDRTSMQPPEFVSTHTSSLCKKAYVDSGNNKTTLFVFSIGLEHDNEPLFSLEQEPWSSFSKNALRPPKNSDLAKEVGRRATASNLRPAPRPSHWPRHQMIQWLEEHPVSDSTDVQFLTFEVLRLREICIRMQQEQRQFLTMDGVSGSVLSRGGNWCGCVPYLQLIMTLMRDDVKSLFLTRGDCLSRAQLDARNSDIR